MLAVESCDLSQAEKEITACKAEKIYTITIFTQNENLETFWSENCCHFDNLLSLENIFFFRSLR